jgi:hypothetical protein
LAALINVALEVILGLVSVWLGNTLARLVWLAKDRLLTLKTASVLGIIVLLAVLGCIIQAL